MSEDREAVYQNEYAKVDSVSIGNKRIFQVTIKGSGKTALSVKDKNQAIDYAKRLLAYSPLYS